MPNYTKQEAGTLMICAVRYCMGRQTYMPAQVQEIVSRHLQDLTDKDMAVLWQDLDDMHEIDYGDPVIDKPGWIRFKAAVKEEKELRHAT